jgi:hypothetical protein
LITDIYFLQDAQYDAIGDSSCSNMKALISIHLPVSVKKIGNNAFTDSTKLVNISLSDSVEMIGSEAFYIYGGSVGFLKLGKLPTSLKTLGDRAFCNAGPGVEISELPLGVTRVGTQCFMGCANVTIHCFGGKGSSLERLGY